MKCKPGYYFCYTDKKCKKIPAGLKMTGRYFGNGKEPEEVGIDKPVEGGEQSSNGNGGNGGVSESKSGDSSLRDWFSKSRSSDGKPGWVQLGGKYAGKPCARQPGQTTKPKCGSSKMKRNLSKKRKTLHLDKNRQDPNPDRKGKAINVNTEEFTTLPLNVEIPTDIRYFNLGLMFRESLDQNSGMLFIFDDVAQQSFYMKETRIPLDIAFINEDGIIESIKQLEPLDETPVSSEGEVVCALEVNRGWFEENNIEVGDEIDIDEAAGEKDACYHKVKSRYSVWPSAYASGALVKCRKKGAKNWGNKTKKEEFELDEKCWPGYEKKGMKTMFGKRYPNCVKKTKKEEVEIQDANGNTFAHIEDVITNEDLMSEAVRVPAKTGNLVDTYFNWRGKYYALKLFFPQLTLPKRSDVQDQIRKVYPEAILQSFKVSKYEPGQPFLYVESAAWTRKEGKNKSGGLNEKEENRMKEKNPGSNLGTKLKVEISVGHRSALE